CKTSQKAYEPTITSKDLYEGREGLDMEFMENTPPKETFENAALPIGLMLYNKGAHDIKDGYFSIGVEKDYMEIIQGSLRSISQDVAFEQDNRLIFNLEGKSITLPEGDEELITFTAKVTKNLTKTDPQSEIHTSLIMATACYAYQTRAVETVCIDTDVYGFREREKPCKVSTLRLSSQGAPVAVTEIESDMLPGDDDPSVVRPRFTITVRNLGDGEVIRERSVEAACSSSKLGIDDWNYITVKAYISGISPENKLDCDLVKEGKDDDGLLLLKGKQDIIRCSYEKGFDETKGAFASPLHIVLDYGYTETISREVKIKKILSH
ncbi:hypothetical protein KY358_01095, partial [Candidatus Woesearchaeota archaeon]|nr:hypothetical protein [Candidatus Woesearchaeota archaeon]